MVRTNSVIGFHIPMFNSLPHHSNSVYSGPLRLVAVNAFYVYFNILNLVMAISFCTVLDVARG
jgi:hypothetical protein